MIEKLRIQNFDKIYELMELSFPPDEYRTYDGQKALLKNPAYSIYVLKGKGEEIKAFIAVWEFDELVFIEHLAVNPKDRNGGTGAYMLKELVKLLGKAACLEVEPPETRMSTRRIGFYKRNNFFLNEYPYMQPALAKGKKAIPLLIMTFPSQVEEEGFKEIREILYSKVYNIHDVDY